ncbi:MAG: VWA domain-containing protein [Spirochaetales bacterium]|nr:VWA domain-containing protein [Spirochaetales bacterium]
MKKLIFITSIWLLSFISAAAEQISISGVDTSGLLFSGTVSLYVNITDNQGETVTDLRQEDLAVSESLNGRDYTPVEIVNFSEEVNEDKGISFLLLVDNSGSMYDRLDGKATDKDEERRINSAVKAIYALIQSMQGSEDKTGIALFNTFYKELAPVGSNRNSVIEAMQMIEKPGKDESFTELNAAVISAAGKFTRERGRKIIIVLSDGENYPYKPVRGEDSPQFGSSLYSTDDMIRELKRNSTTLYGINFGTTRDRDLEKAVISSGGFLFEAGTREELEAVYKTIRERILSEYLIEYRSGTEYAEQKYVKAEIPGSGAASGPAFYFSGSIFGKPSENFSWFYFASLALVFMVVVYLVLKKQSAPAEKAELEVTDFSGATQMFVVDGQKTVIGSSDSNDVTVVNGAGQSQSEATIIFDEKKSVYTVVSDSEVMVNNNPVKTRVLEAGDVININGATIIFNDKDQ